MYITICIIQQNTIKQYALIKATIKVGNTLKAFKTKEMLFG